MRSIAAVCLVICVANGCAPLQPDPYGYQRERDRERAAEYWRDHPELGQGRMFPMPDNSMLDAAAADAVREKGLPCVSVVGRYTNRLGGGQIVCRHPEGGYTIYPASVQADRITPTPEGKARRIP